MSERKDMFDYIMEALDIWKDEIKNAGENNRLQKLLEERNFDKACAMDIELSMAAGVYGEWPDEEPPDVEEILPGLSPEENENIFREYIKSQYKGGSVMPIHFLKIVMVANNLGIPWDRIKDLEYEITKDLE